MTVGRMAWRALRILAEGEVWVEGHATQAHGEPGGAIVNVSTFRKLEEEGLAESFEVGRIAPVWKGRITQAGRDLLTRETIDTGD